jgi:hypothetical protein
MRIVEGVNLRYIVSTFVNVTMYSQYNNNMIIKKALTKQKKSCVLHKQYKSSGI